jgi:hypothetical protein
MNLDRLVAVTASGLLLAGLYACGSRDAKSDADTAAAASTDSAPAQDVSTDAPQSSVAADPGQKPLTVADIDRWEKGMAAELEAVNAAGAKRKAAKTGDDTLSAMMAVQDQATMEIGAKAADVEGERYNLIRSTFSTAASYWRRPSAGSTPRGSRLTSAPSSGPGTRPSSSR